MAPPNVVRVRQIIVCIIPILFPKIEGRVCEYGVGDFIFNERQQLHAVGSIETPERSRVIRCFVVSLALQKRLYVECRVCPFEDWLTNCGRHFRHVCWLSFSITLRLAYPFDFSAVSTVSVSHVCPVLHRKAVQHNKGRAYRSDESKGRSHKQFEDVYIGRGISKRLNSRWDTILISNRNSSEREYLRALITVAIYAGPWRGELLKLRWSNVDFALNLINFTETKTNKDRAVPMEP